MTEPTITAALLVIGDEILSGRTKDKNIGHVAETLTNIGIDLREVRVVPDVAAEIVAAIDALRHRSTYLFTTGGIGPTHDDITADCVAEAFGVPIDVDERAVAELLKRYRPEELNEARLRMARIPAGAELVENRVSRAPGFRLGNVIVMAGVPAIMQAMLEAVIPSLRTGARVISRSVEAGSLAEGLYSAGLREVAAARRTVSIGSYPSFAEGRFRNSIVVRGRDAEAVDEAAEAVEALVRRLQAEQRAADADG